MITELTPEQKAKIPEYLDKYYKKVYNSKPIDVEALTEAINYIYQQAGYKIPKIIIADSLCHAQKLANELNNTKNQWYQFAYYGNLSDYGWTAFYDYINHELMPEYKNELWTKWQQLVNSNVYDMIQFDTVVIAVNMPTIVNIDDNKRIHSATGYAVQFADGWGVCAWHGLIVPSWIILEPEKLTIEKIVNEQNAEIRRVMVESFGRDKLLSLPACKKVHSDEWGDLYHIDTIKDCNGQSYAFLKVINSTPEPDGHYKDYFLRINPTLKTAREAWLSTFAAIPDFTPGIQT